MRGSFLIPITPRPSSQFCLNRLERNLLLMATKSEVYRLPDVRCLRTETTSDPGGSGDRLRCKRLLHLAYTLQQSQPSAVARRNARERKRVKLVNLGFATLREHVPRGVKNKKLSKVETLRSAIEYIKQLEQLLEGQENYHRSTFVNPSSSSSGDPCTPVSDTVMSASSSPASSLRSEDASPYTLLSTTEDSLLDIGCWFS